MALPRVGTISPIRSIWPDTHPSVQVIDAVSGACSQICVHLSDSLYDMVLNMIFDYASTNVRSNAVRAIHQLVECVANANPEKTLARFFHFCERNIRTEIENGASSLRTTTTSSAPLPSDATLHWSETYINPRSPAGLSFFSLARPRYPQGCSL